MDFIIFVVCYILGTLVMGRFFYRVFKQHSENPETIPFYCGLALFWPCTLILCFIVDTFDILSPVIMTVIRVCRRPIMFCLTYRNNP